jgi:ATP-dependent DNA helicase RecG
LSFGSATESRLDKIMDPLHHPVEQFPHLPCIPRHHLSWPRSNTRHPIRVVGLNRVRLDEYPPEALREALVNAAAHRDYKDGSRKIMLEVFSDRVVISSPGLPPPPITLQKLRTGKYRTCSRIPFWRNASLSFIALRSAAVDSGGCTTR